MQKCVEFVKGLYKVFLLSYVFPWAKFSPGLYQLLTYTGGQLSAKGGYLSECFPSPKIAVNSANKPH